ncbi:MAG: hypothetical protein ACX93N_08850 [Pseudohaliea sp.]
MKRIDDSCRARVPALLLCSALALAAPAMAHAGLLDKLKEQAKKAVEEVVDETREAGGTAVAEAVGGGATPVAKPSGEAEAAVADPGGGPAGAPSDGEWQGQLSPAGKKSIGSHGGLRVTLAGATKLLRYSGGTGDCVAELEGAGGEYSARFLTGQSRCGSRATLRLGGDGQVRLRWEDAPGMKAGERVYGGRLERRTRAWPRKAWSLAGERRKGYDVVDFFLGMSYEDALARIDREPEMTHEWRMISTANGKGTLSLVQVVELKAGKDGSRPAESLSLQFEAQSPAEMAVAQDPAVLARREEIDTLARERAQQERAIREEYRAASRRTGSRNGQQELAARRASLAQERQEKLDALPAIPDKPPLRPDGADAELVFIGRELTFPRGARPHIDKVTDALVSKYGPPSVRTDNRLALQWAFTAEGERIADAAGGACDVVTPAARQDHSGEVAYYGLSPRWVAPGCGFTVAVDLRPRDDGGVYSMRFAVYDQRRLLGDNWYRTVRLTQATVEAERAAQEAAKAVDAPDL